MSRSFEPFPRWSTSAFDEVVSTSLTDLHSLRDHLSACSQDAGRLLWVQRGAQVVHGALAARLMTTLTLAAALTGALSLIW
jgi:hypothetical protein